MQNKRLITAILTWAKDGTAAAPTTQEEVPNVDSAKASWSYLKSLGLDVVLLRMPLVQTGQKSYDERINRVDENLDIVERLFAAQAGFTAAEFDQCFASIAQTDWIPYTKKIAPNTTTPPPTSSSSSGTTETTIKKKRSVADLTAPMVIRYDISTSICMQFFGRHGTNHCRSFLSQKLWQRDDGALGAVSGILTTAQAEKSATDRLNTLKKIVDALPADPKPVILFNWRNSGMNKVMNTGNEHMEYLLKLAKDRCHLVVINQYPDTVKRHDHQLNMFTTAGFEDRRIIACFWSKVVSELQLAHPNPKDGRIVGFMGGRSGSMDIASFVGLRTLSWDVGVFHKTLSAPEASRLDDTKRIAQSVYVLRLFNQKPMNWIAFLDYRPDQEHMIKLPESYTGTSTGKQDVLSLLLKELDPVDQKFCLEGDQIVVSAPWRGDTFTVRCSFTADTIRNND